MNQKILLLSYFLLFSFFGYASGPYATMVSIQHVVCENMGAVEFELNGNPDDYSYYWEHGPTTLSLNSLAEGSYTLVVTHVTGCVEKFPVEILEVEPNCSLSYTYQVDRNCKGVVRVSFSNGAGLIDNSQLVVTWDDVGGGSYGLIRPFFADDGFYACVTVTWITDGVVCCQPEVLCIAIPSKLCEGIPIEPNGPKGQVVVNETGRGGHTGNRSSEGAQYVELLVVGNGLCGDTFDIGGYILDDNNGYLISGGELVSSNNFDEIGISPGYLTFMPENVAWKAVPNGSLIIVQSSSNAFLPDDPTDQDNDYVYVVSADDSDYFFGNTGNWINDSKTLDYSQGQIADPSWDLIGFEGAADGFQVRTPDNLFCHGVSIGKTAFEGTDKFEMWISDSYPSESNIAFEGADWFEPNDFSVTSSMDTILTPGLSNSLANQELISNLITCEKTENASIANNRIKFDKNHILSNDIFIFPNPAEDILNVKLVAEEAGEVKMNIINTFGQVVLSRNWEYPSGTDIRTIDMSAHRISAGWYNVEFNFSDHKITNKRLVILR